MKLKENGIEWKRRNVKVSTTRGKERGANRGNAKREELGRVGWRRDLEWKGRNESIKEIKYLSVSGLTSEKWVRKSKSKKKHRNVKCDNVKWDDMKHEKYVRND